jgi:hypothetical protein
LTRNLCALLERPHVLIDARQVTETTAAAELIGQFIENHGIQVLNVGGPRASGWEEGYEFAVAVIGKVLRAVGGHLGTEELEIDTKRG